MNLSTLVALLTLGLFRDRSKLGPVPARLVRWAAVALLLLGPLGAWQADQPWQIVLAVAGLGLVLTLATFAHAYLLLSHQQKTTALIYKEWAHRLGAPSIGSLRSSTVPDINKRVKADRRTLRSRLRLDWDGRVIRAVRFTGEGGKVSIDDVRKFGEYMLTAGRARSDQVYLIATDQLHLGEVEAHLTERATPEAQTYALRWKLFELLYNSGLLDIIDTPFPTITFPDGAPERGRFKRVEVEGVKPGAAEYRHGAFLDLVQRTWPEAGTWRMSEPTPTSLVLRAHDRNSQEMIVEAHGEALTKLATAALAQASVYVRASAQGVAVQGESLKGFTLVFDGDALLRRENLQDFLKAFSKLLRQRYPASWAMGNRLVDEASLVFQAQG